MINFSVQMEQFYNIHERYSILFIQYFKVLRHLIKTAIMKKKINLIENCSSSLSNIIEKFEFFI